MLTIVLAILAAQQAYNTFNTNIAGRLSAVEARAEAIRDSLKDLRDEIRATRRERQ